MRDGDLERKLQEIIAGIKPPDPKAAQEAARRQNRLTKPPGSLGRLEELSVRLAGIRGDPLPEVRRKAIIVMAGDHGVAEEGVSAYPQEVTSQMVANFLAGGAGINVLGRHVGARVVVVNMGVKYPVPKSPEIRGGEGAERYIERPLGLGTANFAREPAMSREQALRSLLAGAEILEEEAERGLDIVGVGDMGIGNTTASAAIASVMLRRKPEEVVGRGTGVDERGLERKIKAVREGLELHRPSPEDPVGVLAGVGGFEIGGIAGVILGAAARRIPVVLDGFIAGAAALIAAALAPLSRDYMIASHLSAERGHKLILEKLELRPLLDLEMRLGEGTGAALGIFLCEAAAKILREMATFEEAGVSEKIE